MSDRTAELVRLPDTDWHARDEVSPAVPRRPSRVASWLSPRIHGVLLVGLLVVFALSTLAWDWLYRRGQPFDIDESGYLGISLIDFNGLHHGGVWGWLHQVEAFSIQAPLTTAVTTPFFLVFGPHPLAALLAPLCFTLFAIYATFQLARRVAGPSGAWAATILTASAPVIVNYSRDYHFAPAATAVTVGALYAFVRSNGLRSRSWSAAFGVFVGLMPLARTMTVAFLPGFAVAAVVCLLVGGERPRRILNGLLAAVLAVVVAASWLGVNGNGQGVWNYLTGYGYGSVSTQYGASHPLFSFSAWLGTVQTFAGFVLLPHLLLFLAGGLAFVVLAAQCVVAAVRGPGGLRQVIGKAATSPLTPLALVVGLGFLALASSANQGSAFSEPLVPAMCVLTAWSLRRILRSRAWVASTAVAVVAVVAVLPSLPGPWPAPGPWTVSAPVLGSVAVTTGQGIIQQYVQSAGAVNAQRDPDAVQVGRRWVQVNDRTAGLLQSQSGGRALIAFGFRHRLFNVNSVNLAQLTAGNGGLPLVVVPRESLEDSVAAYRSWLRSGSAASSCLLLTASGDRDEFAPVVTGESMSAAAVQEGFSPIGHWRLPDGRAVVEWQRPVLCPR